MSQKATVLKMLRDAGERGVRSDTFYREFMGRGVARIYDLRQDGYEISSAKEGKYTRYRLVGVGNERVGAHSRPSGSSLVSGEDSGARVTHSPLPGSGPASARLFDLPAMSAVTNREAA